MLRTAFSYQVHQCPKSSRAVEAIYLSSVYSFMHPPHPVSAPLDLRHILAKSMPNMCQINHYVIATPTPYGASCSFPVQIASNRT